MSEIANVLALTLATLFGLAAMLNLAAPRFLRRAYARWQFARGFHYVSIGRPSAFNAEGEPAAAQAAVEVLK